MTEDVPPQLARLWGLAPAPARRGPRPRLDVEEIARAGIALADAEGLAAVSMARVAASLGVTTMALYRYVSGKEELVALMADLAVAPAADDDGAGASTAPPGTADGDVTAWRRRLEHWCRAQLELGRARPWVIPLLAVAPAMGPRRLRWIEQGLSALDGTGLDEGTKAAALGALALQVLQETQIEAAARQAGDAGSDGGPAHPALVDYAALLRMVADPATHPAVFRALEAGAFGGPPGAGDTPDDDTLPIGLVLMLDGLEGLVTRTAAGRPDG